MHISGMVFKSESKSRLEKSYIHGYYHFSFLLLFVVCRWLHWTCGFCVSRFSFMFSYFFQVIPRIQCKQTRQWIILTLTKLWFTCFLAHVQFLSGQTSVECAYVFFFQLYLKNMRNMLIQPPLLTVCWCWNPAIFAPLKSRSCGHDLKLFQSWQNFYGIISCFFSANFRPVPGKRTGAGSRWFQATWRPFGTVPSVTVWTSRSTSSARAIFMGDQKKCRGDRDFVGSSYGFYWGVPDVHVLFCCPLFRIWIRHSMIFPSKLRIELSAEPAKMRISRTEKGI